MIYINIYNNFQCLNTFRYILISSPPPPPPPPIKLPSVMKQNINPLALFRKKERARIAHTFIKIKLQCVVVTLAFLLEYF